MLNEEKLSEFINEKERVKELHLKKIKQQEKILGHLSLKLEECKNFGLLEKEGLLLQANLYKIKKGQKTVIVEDWEDGSTKTIAIEGDKEEHLSQLFKKARRLKRGIGVIERKIEGIHVRLNKLIEELNAIDQATSPKELRPFLKQTIKPKSPEINRKTPYRVYYSESGYKILVGKSKKDNDYLSFKVAEPHDIWLHANDFPGSHVIIKAKRNDEPDSKTIEEAGLLAIDASQAKDQTAADVVITRQKNLRRVKGRPGQVTISEKKVRRIIVDKKKLSLIKERSNLLP